jgi:anaerobic magnesium-protoporphyrin IX monomethyl ester cyclase
MTETQNSNPEEIQKRNLRTLFITLPQREAPGNQPPYGPLAVMTALKRAGHTDNKLFHIDALRPDREDAIQEILDFAPDILAVSAVVSTAYENCKFFSNEIKRRRPETTIVVGGNMVATAEVLLSYNSIDYCVSGEGEYPAPLLWDWFAKSGSREELRDIPGLVYLEDEKLVNTGDAPKIGKEELYAIDWDYFDDNLIDVSFPLLSGFGEGSSDFMTWFPDSEGKISNLSPRDKKRLNERMAMFFCSRGCISRCTFCHRFVKGFLQSSTDSVVERIRELRTRYNIGAFYFSDECFGADKKWLKMFCEKIKTLDILWKVAGTRVDCVNPDTLKMMRDAGCCYVGYGLESGSPRILEVMEKRVNLKDNLNAMHWTVAEGLASIPQLVIGMPGETRETIDETIEFVSKVLTLDKRQNPLHLSTNYAQALPGTPLYEYARSRGIIATTLPGEEAYLMLISDKNASDASTTLNFTNVPKAVYLSWKIRVGATVNYRYAQVFGRKHFYKRLFGNSCHPGLFHLLKKRDLLKLRQSFPALNFWLSRVITPVIILRTFLNEGFVAGGRSLADCLTYAFKMLFGVREEFSYKSLRKILKNEGESSYCGDPMMVPLRKGR